MSVSAPCFQFFSYSDLGGNTYERVIPSEDDSSNAIVFSPSLEVEEKMRMNGPLSDVFLHVMGVRRFL